MDREQIAAKTGSTCQWEVHSKSVILSLLSCHSEMSSLKRTLDVPKQQVSSLPT